MGNVLWKKLTNELVGEQKTKKKNGRKSWKFVTVLFAGGVY